MMLFCNLFMERPL